VIPAYRAEQTLEATVERIPAEFFDRGGTVVIVNDASPDGTGAVAEGIADRGRGVVVVHHEKNRGYGGAQKTGLRAGLERGCGAFAVVHADGQYAPELVTSLLAPIEAGEAEIVQGSRMVGGGALAGGMPLVRYAANRALTALENLCFGTRMAEFHSGYMLYSRRLLGEVPFGALQDNFNFDAEMILLAWLRGYPCREIAIPTRYDATTSSLKPVPYGLQVLRMVCRHLGGHYRRLAGVPSLGAAAPEPLSPGQTTTPIHS
jgi:glycosyltransferase involved in cell wall biosynthesis